MSRYLDFQNKFKNEDLPRIRILVQKMSILGGSDVLCLNNKENMQIQIGTIANNFHGTILLRMQMKRRIFTFSQSFSPSRIGK